MRFYLKGYIPREKRIIENSVLKIEYSFFPLK